LDVLDLVSFLVSVCPDLNSLEAERFLAEPITRIKGAGPIEVLTTINETDTVFQLFERFAQGIHRVAVLAEGKISNVVSQSDALRWLLEHRNELAEAIGTKTVKQLKLVKEWVLFVSKHERTLNAYKKMVQHGVSAIAVLDVDKLVGSLSASDLRTVRSEDFKVIGLPIMEFLGKQRAGKPALMSYGKETDSLIDVLERVVGYHYHRMWVMDDKHKPIGVVSLTDICRTVLAAIHS